MNDSPTEHKTEIQIGPDSVFGKVVLAFVAGAALTGFAVHRMSAKPAQECLTDWGTKGAGGFAVSISGTDSTGRCFTFNATPAGGILTETAGLGTSLLGPSNASYLDNQSLETSEAIFREPSGALTINVLRDDHLLRFTYRKPDTDKKEHTPDDVFEIQY